MRIVICGGGTGGHIYPALVVANELRRRGLANDDILWIGTRGQMEEKLVPRAGLTLETIMGGPIVGVPLSVRLANAARLAWSMAPVTRLFRRFRPDVLFMTGGYVNVPVALIARARRVPAAIFLPDIEPGAAIKALSRFAKKVACTTDESQPFFPTGKTVTTGYPVRSELRAASLLDKGTALAEFELTTERKTVLVFGGSRGARSINRAVMAGLPQLLERAQLIHVSGSLDWPEVNANAEQLPETLQRYYRPHPYLHDEGMGAALRSADLVIARSGAGMLGESPAFGVPAILVPYPHAWRYQKINADYLASRGAAIRLDDELLSEKLVPTVMERLFDEGRLSQMAAAAKAMDVPDASGKLADLLITLGTNHD